MLFSDCPFSSTTSLIDITEVYSVSYRGVNEPFQAQALLEHARKIGRSKMARLETARKFLARNRSSHENFGSLTSLWYTYRPAVQLILEVYLARVVIEGGYK